MFVNTQEFRKEALYFEKHGRYDCGEPGTGTYQRYWDEQKRRCLYGYTVGGVWITGLHYSYLNFNQIEIVIKKGTGRGGDRVVEFPKFWDVDYVFFTSLAIAKNGMYGADGMLLETHEERVEAYKKLPIDIGLKLDKRNLEGGNHVFWDKARGVGAEQPHSEPLITPHGEITMGDVKIGTQLYDRYGNITNVIEVLPQGYKEIYELELLDGRKIRCGENHLWTVFKRFRNKKEEYETLTTKQLIDKGLTKKAGENNIAYKYRIPSIEAVPFKEQALPIHPYILGYLLGDGSINGHNIKFATDDQEVVNKFKELLPEYNINKDSSNNNYLIAIKEKFSNENKHYKNSQFGVNPLKREIENLKLNVKCDKKFIPDIYKYSSISQRAALIKGLMDSDGSINDNGQSEFTNKCEKLIDDLAYVLRSLGIYCRKGFSERNGEKIITDRTGRVHSFEDSGYFRLYISTNKKIFYIKRKREKLREDKYCKSHVPIINIRKTGLYEKQSCIIVDNKEHLYLTTDFILTHNSWKASSIAARQFHHLEKSKTYMIADNEDFLNDDGLFSKFIFHRSFLNRNTAFGVSSLQSDTTDMHFISGYYPPGSNRTPHGFLSEVMAIPMAGNPDKVRGKRGSYILWEEFGNLRKAHKAWDITHHSLNEGGVQYGINVAFGTGGTVGEASDHMEDFALNPRAYGLLVYENRFDKDLEGMDCCLFTPACYNIQMTDEQGNSDLEKGNKYVEDEYEIARLAKSSTKLMQKKAELPLNILDSLMSTSNNKFAVEGLEKWKNKVKNDDKYKNMGIPKRLSRNFDGDVIATYDQDLIPVTKYPHRQDDDVSGCVVEFDTPYVDPDTGKIPDNLYFICVDPYAVDDAEDITSLGSAFVMMNFNNVVPNDVGDRVVASWVGRRRTTEEYSDILFMLAERWNAKICMEADRGTIVDDAKTRNKTHLLVPELSLAYDEEIKVKNPSNIKYGVKIASGRFNTRMLVGDQYLVNWLLRERKTKDERILHNFNFIYDIGLLEEFTKYKQGQGNYDRISALRIGMFYSKQLIHDNKVASKQNPHKYDQLSNLRNTLANAFN